VILTPNAIRYTLNQLLAIALPAIERHITKVDRQGAVVEILNEHKLYFHILEEEERKQLIEGLLMPTHALSFDNHTQIPLFPLNPTTAFYTSAANSITFTCDLITLPFLLLSHYDDYPTATRDQHDRQTYKNSLNDRYNVIDFPLVDHYALLIRKAVLDNFPDIAVTPRRSKIIVTHDIDELYRFPNLYKTMKTIFGGDLWIRKSPKFFLQSVNQLFKTLQNRINDPYIAGLKQLIETIQNLQHSAIEQIVFIKSLKPNEPDATYDIHDPVLAQLIDYLKSNEVKIGLHSGYHTYNNPEIYQWEQSRLADLLQYPVILGRQHFLRYSHATLQVWQQNGLVHDYTLGFAEREGFRCGTCHPYPVYDIEKDCVTNIIEHPLIVMDGTFFQYQQVSPEAACRKMRQLCETCRQVEGDFVLLWHNTIVYREFKTWFRDCFCKFFEEKEIK
jgi:hypothetical protein